MHFAFQGRIVAICGNNGVGKTNLLDAIYYLCFTKSYFTKSDQQNIRHGSSGFRTEAVFELNGKDHQVWCIVREDSKKELFVDGDACEKFSSHIGRFPALMIAPDDAQIITGISEERRKFLDALISQLDQEYLQKLIQYNKVLQLRNSYLKSMAEQGRMDTQLLDVYDEQLVASGSYLFKQRKEFLSQMLPLARDFYLKISGLDEGLEIEYETQLNQLTFHELLKESRQKDILYQRSLSGIHKDEILIRLKGLPFKNLASQGQRKSLLFALKLAAFELIRKNKGFSPILLLDDVFEKLDSLRMHHLLDWVCLQNQGQIFITDTDRSRIAHQLNGLGLSHQLIEL